MVGTPDNPEQDGDLLASSLAALSLDQHAFGKPMDSTRKGSRVSASSEISTIILAMRKIREAIVASARNDSLAKSVYIFIIRTTILWRHPESYHPALLHLFGPLHYAAPLSKEEEKEFLGYLLLDLACRQQNFPAAFRIRTSYGYRVKNIDLTLSALVHGDWFLFRKVKSKADSHRRCLMEWADEKMASHAMQCLGRSYLRLPRDYVEKCTGMSWEQLKELKKMSWTLEGEKVMIRQMKKR